MFNEYRAIIKNKNFVFLWSSQILSQLAINVLNFLFLVKLFEKTESTIATSFLWISYAIPAILIGPIAASIADLVDKRKILIATNLLQALLIFLFALSHQASFFLLYGVVMAYSFLNQFYVPAELAAIPSLISKNNLAQANGLFFITQQAAIIIGFGAAGLIGSFFGFTKSLYISSFLLFIAFLSVINLSKMKAENTLPKHFEKAFFDFFQKILGGYRYIKENNSILIPLILLLIMHTSSILVIVNIPVMAKQIFAIDVNLAGILIAVPIGLGAVIGALIIPKKLKKGLRKISTIELSFKVLTFTLFSYAFIIPEISGVLKIVTSVIIIFLSGLSVVGVLIPTQTFLQEHIPGGLRGRVFGNYWFLATIVVVFPVIFSGTITELFGVRLFIFLLTLASLGMLIFINQYARRYIKDGFSF